MRFAEGIHWTRRRAEGPLGKVTSLWEDGVCLGVKANTREFIVERQVRHLAHGTVKRKLVTERRTRDNLGVVIGVLRRKNDDDPKADGDSPTGEVVVTDNKGCREHLEKETSALQRRRE